MVFTFLAARGLPVGASLVEPGCVATARALEATAAARGVQLLLPSDIVVADSFSPGAAARVVPAAAIPNGWMVRAEPDLRSPNMVSDACIRCMHACCQLCARSTSTAEDNEHWHSMDLDSS